jgi:hypothetical protein
VDADADKLTLASETPVGASALPIGNRVFSLIQRSGFHVKLKSALSTGPYAVVTTLPKPSTTRYTGIDLEDGDVSYRGDHIFSQGGPTPLPQSANAAVGVGIPRVMYLAKDAKAGDTTIRVSQGSVVSPQYTVVIGRGTTSEEEATVTASVLVSSYGDIRTLTLSQALRFDHKVAAKKAENAVYPAAETMELDAAMSDEDLAVFPDRREHIFVGSDLDVKLSYRSRTDNVLVLSGPPEPRRDIVVGEPVHLSTAAAPRVNGFDHAVLLPGVPSDKGTSALKLGVAFGIEVDSYARNANG